MRKYVGGGVQKQTRALDLGYSLHKYGNPVIQMDVVAPQVVDAPTDVEHGEWVWTMPSGRAAARAAMIIHVGIDVDAKLAELGGVRK